MARRNDASGRSKKAAAKPKSRSGPNIPEAQRGTVAIKVRVPRATADHLKELVADGGYNRSDTVAAIIDSQWREWQAARAERP